MNNSIYGSSAISSTPLGTGGGTFNYNMNCIVNNNTDSTLNNTQVGGSTNSHIDATNNFWGDNVPVQDDTGSSTFSVNPIATVPFSHCEGIGGPQTPVEILAEYGVIVSVDGIPASFATANPNISGSAQAWGNGELDEIVEGVRNTAQAFYMLRNEGQIGTEAEHAALFRTVMGDFAIIRVQSGFDIDDTNPNNTCDGAVDIGCTDNFSGFIAFYGNLPQGVNQYVMVHELGHRFNARSDGGNGRTPDSLYGRMENANQVYDQRGSGQVLFGLTRSFALDPNTELPVTRQIAPEILIELNGRYYVNEWFRRDRGWGSGPASVYDDYGNLTQLNLSAFQQNSFTVASYTQPLGSSARITEIDEAAADMFLNWVDYQLNHFQRVQEDIIEGGFRNMDWDGSRGCINGCFNGSNPDDPDYVSNNGNPLYDAVGEPKI